MPGTGSVPAQIMVNAHQVAPIYRPAVKLLFSQDEMPACRSEPASTGTYSPATARRRLISSSTPRTRSTASALSGRSTPASARIFATRSR